MFDTYQKHASKTFKPFTELDANQAQLLNWAVGLAGETGEVSEIVKHHIYGKEPLDKMELAKEVGDVLWYLAAICTCVGMDLSAVAELNINKLDYRYGGGSYSKEASAVRHDSERKFTDTFVYKCLQAKINKTPAPLNVIFVGPDGSGKTTIAKRLAEKLAAEGFTYHKCDYRQEDKPQLSLQLLEQSNVIFDRFYYPDDIIYSRITWEHDHPVEEPMDWSTDYWKSYDAVVDQLCNVNTLYIYVGANEDVLKERSKRWADDYISVDDLHKICTLYSRWMQFIVTRPVILMTLDTSDTPENAVDENVDKCIEMIRKAQAVFANQAEDTYITGKEETEDGDQV